MISYKLKNKPFIIGSFLPFVSCHTIFLKKSPINHIRLHVFWTFASHTSKLDFFRATRHAKVQFTSGFSNKKTRENIIMTNMGYLKLLVDEIHSATVAIIVEDGHHQTRIIDIMFEKNPYMKGIYPGDTIVMNCENYFSRQTLKSSTGDLYDTE